MFRVEGFRVRDFGLFGFLGLLGMLGSSGFQVGVHGTFQHSLKDLQLCILNATLRLGLEPPLRV